MGYILTGVDVFVWVLLSAGSILVPIVVLTICCIKKHYETEKRLTRLYMSSREGKNSGMVGPYSTLDRNEKPSLNPGVVIVSSALGGGGGGGGGGGAGAVIDKGLETPNTIEKNKVRFVDDSSAGERRMNQYNNLVPQNIIRNNLVPQNIVNDEALQNNNNNNNASDLRGLKDAINQFVPRPTVKPTKTNTNQLPILPNLGNILPSLQFDPYGNESDATENASNLSGSYNINQNTGVRGGNQIGRQPTPPEPVYSISNSYRLPQVQHQAAVVSNQTRQMTPSIENIYSKVLTTSKNNQQQQQHQEDDDNEQPLYMNTPYTAQMQNRDRDRDRDEYSTVNFANQQQQQLPQPPGPGFKPPTYGSWNDSSV